jgi:hypothetical protein
MKKIFQIIVFYLLLFTSVSTQLHAQLTETIDVFTGFEPRLAEVEKFSSQPSIADTFRVETNVKYEIVSLTAKTNFNPDTISAIKMKTEPISKLHRFYLKAGFGNYLTPYIDFFANSLRTKKDFYSVRIRHLSSQGNISDRGNPSISDNELNVNYSHVFNSSTLDLKGTFNYNELRYYNYSPAIDSLVTGDSTRQHFIRGIFNADFYSMHRNDSIKFNHKIKLDFYHLSDRWNASENSVTITADINKYTNKFAREFFGSKLRFQYLNYKNDAILESHGVIVNLSPYMRFGGKWWNLHIGVDLSLGVDDSTKFNVYPDVEMKFNIFRNYIVAYGTFTGKYRRNSFDVLVGQNPFILRSNPLSNMNERIQLKGGVKGSFTSSISYNASASYSIIDNFAYFVNDTTSFFQRGFQMIGAQTNLLIISGDLSYQWGEKLLINASANYYLYSVSQISNPWHRPTIDATLSARYNLRDKIIVHANLFFIGPQKARDFVFDASSPLQKKEFVRDIPSLLDFNIGAEYRLTKMLSFWVNFNNIANFRYQRWYGYPTQQFNIIGGLTFGI